MNQQLLGAAIVPTSLGMPLPESVPVEVAHCFQCNEPLAYTGTLRTYQMALSIQITAEPQSFVCTVELDCGILCSGCCSLPFLYTIPVFPSCGFGPLAALMESNWPSGGKVHNFRAYVLRGLRHLVETRTDVLFARTALGNLHACVLCEETRHTYWCPKCKCARLCRDTERCPSAGLHRWACETICKSDDGGGVFDLDHIKWT